MKTILFLLLISGSAFAKCEKTALYLNMPLVLGKSIFNDQVEICQDGKKLSGELVVPQRFKAKLENITMTSNQLSFSITADEGRGPFTVEYKGDLKENGKYFLGLAKLKGGPILGPFVGIASKKKVDYELIQ